MGNEQSLPDRSAAEAGERVDAQIKEHAVEEENRKLAEYRQKRAAKAAHLAETQTEISESLEEGEVAEAPEPDPPPVHPAPIRSSNSSQQTPTASDLLASFKPRKERDAGLKSPPPANKAKSSDDNEFIGFGHLQESQAENSKTVNANLSNSKSMNAETINTKPVNDDSVKKNKPKHAELVNGRSTNASSGNAGPVNAKLVTAKPAAARPVTTKVANDQAAEGGPAKKKLRLDTQSKPSADPGKPTPGSKVPTSTKAANAPSSTASAKRSTQAQGSAATDDKKTGISGLPKIQKRSSVASPQSPDRDDGRQLPLVGTERPPRWYKETAVPTSRTKANSNVDTLLSSLRDKIRKCRSAGFAQDRVMRDSVFMDVRNKLHTIIFCEVTGPLLKLHRMLHNEDGLPQIFDAQFNGGVNWPFDIRADARELYNKWCRRVFETDILRGIKFQVPASATGNDAVQRSGDSIDPKYKGVASAKYHGNGDLLNGQWWPLQLCCLRDGAHGVTQGGISGSKSDGAYSCIISGGHNYPNVDDGDEVLYCGTDSDDGSITDFTQRMLESVNNQPVRLIRSHNLDSEYAPVIGFRYDGLYDVVESKLLDAVGSLGQRHRFRLVRCPGQDPIRGGSGPERRPTQQEVDEYKKHQRLIGRVRGDT